ncbi:MAG: hypothetical protein ACOYBD_07195 [Bilifractor sp.]|jgi:hypothetical protein
MANRPEEISETMKEAGCSDDCIRRFFETKQELADLLSNGDVTITITTG